MLVSSSVAVLSRSCIFSAMLLLVYETDE